MARINPLKFEDYKDLIFRKGLIPKTTNLHKGAIVKPLIEDLMDRGEIKDLNLPASLNILNQQYSASANEVDLDYDLFEIHVVDGNNSGPKIRHVKTKLSLNCGLLSPKNGGWFETPESKGDGVIKDKIALSKFPATRQKSPDKGIRMLYKVLVAAQKSKTYEGYVNLLKGHKQELEEIINAWAVNIFYSGFINFKNPSSTNLSGSMLKYIFMNFPSVRLLDKMGIKLKGEVRMLFKAIDKLPIPSIYIHSLDTFKPNKKAKYKPWCRINQTFKVPTWSEFLSSFSSKLLTGDVKLFTTLNAVTVNDPTWSGTTFEAHLKKLAATKNLNSSQLDKEFKKVIYNQTALNASITTWSNSIHNSSGFSAKTYKLSCFMICCHIWRELKKTWDKAKKVEDAFFGNHEQYLNLKNPRVNKSFIEGSGYTTPYKLRCLKSLDYFHHNLDGTKKTLKILKSRDPYKVLNNHWKVKETTKKLASYNTDFERWSYIHTYHGQKLKNEVFNRVRNDVFNGWNRNSTNTYARDALIQTIAPSQTRSENAVPLAGFRSGLDLEKMLACGLYRDSPNYIYNHLNPLKR